MRACALVKLFLKRDKISSLVERTKSHPSLEEVPPIYIGIEGGGLPYITSNGDNPDPK